MAWLSRSSTATAQRAASTARFEALVLDFLAYLEFERGLVAQHARCLPHRPAPVRRLPRQAPSGRDGGGARRRRRLPRRPRDRQRPARLLAGDDQPQDGLPALLLPPPAPRGADRRGPDGDAHARPTKSRKLPRVLSLRPRSSGSSRASTGGDPISLRDRALLEVMYGCGLRASEAIGPGRQRRRPAPRLRAPARQGVQGADRPAGPRGRARGQALPARRAGPSSSARGPSRKLFVNFRGGPLTRQGLYKIIQRHAKEVGLDGQDEPAHPAPHLRDPPAVAAAATCARCRRCSATPTSRRHSSTPTSPASGSRRSTSRPTPGPPLPSRRPRACLNQGDAGAPRGRDDPPPARAGDHRSADRRRRRCSTSGGRGPIPRARSRSC